MREDSSSFIMNEWRKQGKQWEQFLNRTETFFKERPFTLEEAVKALKMGGFPKERIKKYLNHLYEGGKISITYKGGIAIYKINKKDT